MVDILLCPPPRERSPSFVYGAPKKKRKKRKRWFCDVVPTRTSRGRYCTEDDKECLQSGLTGFSPVPVLSDPSVPSISGTHSPPLPLFLFLALPSGAGAFAAAQGRWGLGSVWAHGFACSNHGNLILQQRLQLAHFTRYMGGAGGKRWS